MTKASDNVFPRFLVSEGGSTATPAANQVTVYAKADGLLYSKDDAGAESLLSSAASGVPSGTSFPGGPSTDDLFHRTDLDLIFYYDGTRWLTINVYILPMTHRALASISATTTMGDFPIRQDLDTYITRIDTTKFVSGGTALSASHKWVTTVNTKTVTNSKAAIITLTLDSGTLSNNIPQSSATGWVIDRTTYYGLELVETKTGTPGDLFASYEIKYRLIAT